MSKWKMILAELIFCWYHIPIFLQSFISKLNLVSHRAVYLFYVLFLCIEDPSWWVSHRPVVLHLVWDWNISSRIWMHYHTQMIRKTDKKTIIIWNEYTNCRTVMTAATYAHFKHFRNKREAVWSLTSWRISFLNIFITLWCSGLYFIAYDR